MGRTRWICTAAGGAVIALTPVTAHAAPGPVINLPNVPGRTSITVQESLTGIQLASANQAESRPALSVIKLYIVEYALRHGDGSAQDRALGERAIRYSDDAAAEQLANKYPNAITATAAEYHLTSTTGGYWGSAQTSTADIVSFLEAKKRTDPLSPLFGWMATAAPVAADGTHQNWGTSTLPGVIGTKWGWSDFGPPSVASASFGPDFSIAAQTNGGAADQTADVQGAFIPALPALPPPPQITPDQQGLNALTDYLGRVLPH